MPGWFNLEISWASCRSNAWECSGSHWLSRIALTAIVRLSSSCFTLYLPDSLRARGPVNFAQSSCGDPPPDAESLSAHGAGLRSRRYRDCPFEIRNADSRLIQKVPLRPASSKHGQSLFPCGFIIGQGGPDQSFPLIGSKFDGGGKGVFDPLPCLRIHTALSSSFCNQAFATAHSLFTYRVQ